MCLKTTTLPGVESTLDSPGSTYTDIPFLSQNVCSLASVVLTPSLCEQCFLFLFLVDVLFPAYLFTVGVPRRPAICFYEVVTSWPGTHSPSHLYSRPGHVQACMVAGGASTALALSSRPTHWSFLSLVPGRFLPETSQSVHHSPVSLGSHFSPHFLPVLLNIELVWSARS